MALPDEADRAVAEMGQVGVGELGDVCGSIVDGAAGGGVESPQQVQQSGFPGARFARQGHAFARFDRELQVAEDRQLRFAGAVDLGQIFGANTEFRHWYQISKQASSFLGFRPIDTVWANSSLRSGTADAFQWRRV